MSKMHLLIGNAIITKTTLWVFAQNFIIVAFVLIFYTIKSYQSGKIELKNETKTTKHSVVKMGYNMQYRMIEFFS